MPSNRFLPTLTPARHSRTSLKDCAVFALGDSESFIVLPPADASTSWPSVHARSSTKKPIGASRKHSTGRTNKAARVGRNEHRELRRMFFVDRRVTARPHPLPSPADAGEGELVVNLH